MSPRSANNKTILFRCDGTKEIGLGHVSRCLALAEAFQEFGFNAVFFGRFEAGATCLLDQSQCRVIESGMVAGAEGDLCVTIRMAKDHEASGVVVDSYRVDDGYIEQLNTQVGPTLVIDDFGRLKRYECSALLNFTVGATKLGYPCGINLCLLGPKFFLARRRLRHLRSEDKACRHSAKDILVAMGGVDSQNLSEKVVNYLLTIDQTLSVHVAVSKSYAHVDRLASLLSRFVGKSSVRTQVPDLAEEFAWADLCICGGGLTKYEAAYMGVPAGVFSHNPDQATETAIFAGMGLALDLGLAGTQPEEVIKTLGGEVPNPSNAGVYHFIC